MVKLPGTPTVREVDNPATLEGPKTIEQLDTMQLNGQLAHQAANQESWGDANKAREDVIAQAHSAKMQDGRPQDLNRQYAQVALQDGPDNVTVFTKDPESGEVRYQHRYTHGGVQYRKEFVRLGEHEVYGFTAEEQGKRQTRIYHYLPNGTIREEFASSVTS